MRSKLAIRALLVSCILSFTLIGCGGSTGPHASSTPPPNPGSSGPTPSPSPTPTAAPATPSRFIYGIIDFEAAQGFFGGQIDPASGKVAAVPGTPTANVLGQNIVFQLLPDPQGRFLYSLNLGASSFGVQFGQIGIAGYRIDRNTGALTAIPNPIIFPAVRDQMLAIDGTGHFLYQANATNFDTYTIDQNTGALTLLPASGDAIPIGPESVVTPDGRFLVNEGNNLVEMEAIDPSSGQLTPASAAVGLGGSGGPLIISPDSQFIYVANVNEGTVSVFNIGSGGVLTPVPGSPFTVDAQPAGLSLTPDGRFLYIVFGSPDLGHVKAWAVNPAAGSFTPVAGVQINNATTINVDGSGKFAYVSQQRQLVTYRLDPNSGALTAVSTSAEPWSDLPQDIVLTH